MWRRRIIRGAENPARRGAKADFSWAEGIRVYFAPCVSTAPGDETRRRGREVEGTPLLREHRGKTLIEGSNPSVSARDSG